MNDFYIADDLLYNYGCTGVVKVTDPNFLGLVVTLNKFKDQDFNKFNIDYLDWEDFEMYAPEMWNRNAVFVRFYI